jgi:pantothenate kinase
MKVIIAGGRTFQDFDLLCKKVDKILSRQDEVEVVSGAARGADKLGERYADLRGYKITRFPADWSNNGRAAGFIRNEEMAGYSDALIAFWDGKSKGSKHMIDTAYMMGLDVRVIRY